MIVSKLQRILLLILTAVFFFTLGFFLFLQGTELLLPKEQPVEVEVPTPLTDHTEYDTEQIELNNNQQLAVDAQQNLFEESQTTNENFNSSFHPQVETIEETTRESMKRELSLEWEHHQRYMGILGDYVAVFRGEPGIGGILVEETDIPITKLPEFELDNLRQGITFSTDEEKYSILEGLHFPR